MRSPGFITNLLQEINSLPHQVRSSVNTRHGLNEQTLLRLLSNPYDDRVPVVSPGSDTNMKFYHDDHDRFDQLGTQALLDGKVAYCIYAGGQNIELGRPDALARIPELGMSLLTLKLFQAVGQGPVWIVTTPSFIKEIKDHVAAQVGLDLSRISFVIQNESYQLTPSNSLFFINKGVSLRDCGSGDVFLSLYNSDCYCGFVSTGGKHVVFVDVANVFASLDPAILGHHIESKKKITAEVVKRHDSEEGCILVESIEGLRLVDMKRIDVDDVHSYTVMSTDSYVWDTDIELHNIPSKWCRRQAVHDNAVVVYYQKFFDDVTIAYDTNYIGVARSERMIRVKNLQDLQAVKNVVSTEL
jgi:UDP-N-acetylglucosamine pyrophosphorylase